MQPGRPLRIAVLSPGDRSLRNGATGTQGRFADIFEAFEAAGHHVEPAIYNDDFSDEVREQLLTMDVVLVWVNPIHEGRPRTRLDEMLREISAAGVLVSTHPDVILKLGTKRVLYDTRELGWGCSTELYRNSVDLFDGLASALPTGPRVVKQHRGSSGDGVFKVELAPGHVGTVDAATLVHVRHAKRGALDESLTLGECCARWAHYFDGDSIMVDQPFQPRVAEGMVRCYLVEGRVAGFGHQAVNALIPALPGQQAPTPGERLYHPPTMPEFQELKSTLENDWVPELAKLLEIDNDALPKLWDCDFLLGPVDQAGNDTFILCEINVSSVAPYPPSVVPYIVNAIENRQP